MILLNLNHRLPLSALGFLRVNRITSTAAVSDWHPIATVDLSMKCSGKRSCHLAITERLASPVVLLEKHPCSNPCEQVEEVSHKFANDSNLLLLVK